MSREPRSSLLKQKITISYVIIILIAFIATVILYNGIKNILSIDREGSAPNQKLYLTDKILTLIYDAESDARSYYLYRKKQDLDNYVAKLNLIKKNINDCFSLCKDNIQQIRSLQNIRELLSKQQEVIQNLIKIDRQNEQDLNYQRAFDEIYIQAYELMPSTQLIFKNTIIRHDSVYHPKEKSNFFSRLKSLFSNASTTAEKNPDNIPEEKVITYDTVIQSKSMPDSLLKMMKSSLDKLKMRDNYLKSRVISTETQLLQSDRILLDKIREIVTSLETEEFTLSNNTINHSNAIINKTVISIIWLSGISFVLILFFLILIFRDISKNKLYNKTLENAKKNSDELVQVKEQFLAMMSHEIRTPLSSIIGFSEQLDKTLLNEKQKQFLGRIRMSSDFLLSLVNDTLDLLKINAGKIQLSNIRFNLEDVIRDVYQNFVLAAQTKKIEFTCECDPILNRDVYGDPLRFRQVLFNLTGNAIKFTEKGSVRISAMSLGVEKGALKIKVTFTDTGIGISKEKQSMIFEEFTQADGSVTRKFGGTGLGLAIANKIVGLSGGKITVSSALTEGSTFTIEMDFILADKSVKIVPEEKNIELKEIIKHKTILVVDDDETLLLLVSSMLTNLGIASDTATNAKEAMNKISKIGYDLILTDLNMPEMNGFELMRAIRTIDFKVPVIVITANSILDNRDKNSEFVNYLIKPFKEADLLEKIESVLFPDYKKISADNAGHNKDTKGPEILESKTYSLDEIIEFVGNEPDVVRKIVKSFVNNSLITIKEINELLPERNFKAISRKAHKLIPMYKQFHLFEIVVNLEKLENYNELNLMEPAMVSITQSIIDSSEEVIHSIENDWLRD